MLWKLLCTLLILYSYHIGVKKSFPVLSLSFLLKWRSLLFLLRTLQESWPLGAAGLSFSESQLFALCLSLGRLCHSSSDTSSRETIQSHALWLSPTRYWEGHLLTPNCIFSWWHNILHQKSAHGNGKWWEWQGCCPLHQVRNLMRHLHNKQNNSLDAV